MHKLFKRVCAYLIDMMIIVLISESLSSTTILNPNLNKYNKYSKEYYKLYQTNINFIIQLEKVYKDKKITTKEYEKLVEDYPEYKENIDKYYKDNKITSKNYNKLVKEANTKYEKEYKKYYYLIEKNSIAKLVIYIVLTILYFVFFNYITNGQTLGKKLMKLKIVSIDNKKVSIGNYFIRAIPMYQLIYYVTRLIGIIFLKESSYNKVTSISYSIENILEIAIFTMIMLGTSGRGLHDIIAKTKVEACDKNGNIRK